MSEGEASGGFAEGTVLAGRYRVLGKLGEGAMGAVYVAEHIQIGRKDAIKVLRDQLASDREAIARFLRGARNVSQIRHPNVCAIYDFTETEDGLRFLAMEFVEGPTLKDVLDAEVRLPVERAVDLAAQTADALQAAHEAGIVHRDLKPGNIMVVPGRGARRDVVKVVDFDIAKGPEGGEEVTRLGFVIGTPEYMSPEQLMGEPLDGRSDLYALALVLFRMITGTLPFRAEGAQDLMVARLTSQPLRLDEALPGQTFPEALQHALDRALQRKAVDRQPGVAAFAAEIRGAMAGGAASLRAPGGVAPPCPPPRLAAEVPPTIVAPAVAKGAGGASPAGAARGRAGFWVAFAVAGLAGVGALAFALTRGGGDEGGVAPGGAGVVSGGAVGSGAGGGGEEAPGGEGAGGAGGNTGPLAGGEGTAGGGGTQGGGGAGTAGGGTLGGGGGAGSAGGADASGGGANPASGGGSRVVFGSISALEDALLDLNFRFQDTLALPPPTQLPAIRDTLVAAHEQATGDGQRRAAARLLAIVEHLRGSPAECRRWFAEVRRLADERTDVGYLESLCPPGGP